MEVCNMDGLYILSLNDRQQKWLENNVKDYKKKVRYSVTKVICQLSLKDGTIFFVMIGSGNIMQLILHERVGLVWRELDVKDSEGWRTHCNSPRIRPMNDNMFESTKEFFNTVNSII